MTKGCPQKNRIFLLTYLAKSFQTYLYTSQKIYDRRSPVHRCGSNCSPFLKERVQHQFVWTPSESVRIFRKKWREGSNSVGVLLYYYSLVVVDFYNNLEEEEEEGGRHAPTPPTHQQEYFLLFFSFFLYY